MSTAKYPNSFKDLFMSRVFATDGCWVWTGPTDHKGYGRVWTPGPWVVNGKRRAGMAFAHRVSYEIANGVSLESSQCVLHLCDNPACCNPAHLRTGTIAENNRDMVSKGRHAKTHPRQRGERHPSSVLSESDVRLIRSSNESGRKMAKRFGVSKATIYAIRSRRIWSWMLEAA